MRKYAAFFACSAFCLLVFPGLSVRAQLSLAGIGTPATMNFDIGGTSSCSAASVVWTNNVTIPNCYSNRPTYAYSNGCNNTGALHVAGTGGETALGGRASNSTTLIIWGVRMVNNTGQTITSLNIKYRGEQWNSAQSNVSNTVAFSYMVSAAPITNITTGTYTNFAALNMTNLVTDGGCGGGGSQIDGNTNFNNITACMPVNIPPGSEIMLRWYEPNDACNDHMLCIDDLEVIPLNNNMGIAPITGPVTVCPHDTGSYAATLLPGVTYAWSPLPAGATYIGGAPTGNTAQIDWGTAAPGNYNIVVTPTGNFCGITLNADTITVTVNAPTPVNILAAPPVLCPGQPVTLTSSSATGNHWNTTPPQTTPAIVVNTPGTYILTVTGGCGTPSDTITITSQNPPSVNLGNDTLVCGNAPININLNAQNPGSTYLWQDASGNQTYTATATGTFYVTVTNICGNASDTIKISSQTAPTVDLGNDTLICGNATNILLDATNPGNAVYLWQNNSNAPTFTVTQAGQYYVTVANLCGMASDTMYAVNIPAPQVNLGPDVTICLGNPVTFDATFPGATYLWHDNTTASTHTAATPGTYYVRVSNLCGQQSDTVKVMLKPGPQPTLTDTLLSCGITSLTLNAQNPGSSYRWSTNETSQAVTITQPGDYWVEITFCGSKVVDSVSVGFSTLATSFYSPNTFTPNDDGLNDEYRVMGNFDNVTAFSAMIFNRWGEIVYSATNPDFVWDGKSKGKPVPDGIYFAVFQLKQDCSETGTAEYSSYVTVVR